MNELIQHYLNISGFTIIFKFDEDFDEEITDRIQEHRSYMSFSEGERSRIDIAIMMALRDLAKLRSAISLNVLVIDESDSTLDPDGQIAFMEILKSLEDTNVIIISHNYDIYQEYANKKYNLIKNNNFTYIENS